MTIFQPSANHPLPLMRPLLIAHRGASYTHPENTRLAFEQALTFPVDGIELDLQLTQDERVVVFHDRTLAKTGRRHQRIRNWRATDLQSLRVRGQPIPFLDDILEPLAGRCLLLLEIKRREPANRRNRLERLTQIVLETVLARDLSQRVCLLCFDEPLLRWAHRHYPKIRYVLNQDRPRIIDDDAYLFAYSVNIGRLTSSFATEIRKRNKLLMTYTVNGPRQFARAMNTHADVIMSDKPGWLVDQFSRGEHELGLNPDSRGRIGDA